MARLALTSEPVKIVHILLSGILLTFNLVNAGPTAQRSVPKCLSFCSDAKNFNYESGVTYVYDYSTDIRTSIIEGSDQTSHVRVTAKVEVESSSKCDLKLQLKNVRFEDLTSGPSDYTPSTDPNFFKTQETQLEEHPLLFGFEDGKIEQICSHQDDDVWTLNVKRGIISMLQNSLEKLSSSSNIIHEIDINGRCPTVYVWEGEAWGGGVSYKKIKDLTQCTSRQSQLSAIQSVPYSSSSPIQNIPLLHGNVECMQTIRNRRVESVQCQEEQKFKPFQQRNSGAVTTIAQSLNYVSEHGSQQRRTEEFGAFIRKGLLFESEEPTDGEQDNVKRLQQILENLEQASFPQVTPAAPQLFVDLVDELRRSNERSIRTTFDQTFGTTKEQYVMESLPIVGTASSLAILRDLTLQGILPVERTKAWLSALAFIKHPTLQMIKVVTPLLDEPSMEALLGISSLVNSYCKHHSSCNQDIVVNAVLEKFTSYMGRSCQPESTSAQDVRQMILRLKAIGNAGVLPVAEEISKTSVVVKCFKLTTNPTDIRIAAIDSLRRMSCNSFDHQELVQVFTNVHENTEVRIKAFLALMRCTNRDTMELVKSVLYTEPVNQVASFVWTYLTNLQETNRPEKQQIRDLVSNEFLKNKFSTDARKFSRNYEASQYWPDINVGGGIDSNIIFTEESFLPKSGMFNLTLQLFGESVNVLEFGVRSHGLEHLLEKVFGPQGYFPDNRVAEFLDTNRVKRDTSSSDDTEGLGYLYDQAKPDEEKIPGGSIYTRMFGHEILYKSFEVSQKTPIPNVVDDSGQTWFNIRSILDNLSTGKKTEFRKSMILLDTTYSVATSSGFPLSLGVHAAATMAMKAQGKFNVGRFLETKELEIQGSLQPSTSVNVDGTLTIKIGRANEQFKTGLKLHNKLRSSTAMELNLVVKGNKVLQASLSVPQDKQEVIDVSSQLVFVGPNGEAPLETAPSDNSVAYVSHSCSSNSTSEIVGMRLCMEMNIPSQVSFTPLHPVYFRAYLEKTDTFAEYTFNYRYHSDHSATRLNAVFDTPGSKINRRIAGSFLIDRGMGKIAAGFESVSTALRGEGIYTQFDKSLEISLINQERTTFFLSTGIRNDGNVMKPQVIMTWYGKPLIELKGTIDTTPQPNNTEKTSVELTLKHVTQSPVKVVGEITGTGDDKQATLSIASYILTGSIHSKLVRKSAHWRTKTTVQYSYKGEKEQTAELRAKVQREKKGTLTTSVASFALTSSQFPDMNFSWETQTSNGFCENKMSIGWGKTSWNGHTLFIRQSQGDHIGLRLETSVECAKFNVDYRLEFAYSILPDGFSSNFLARVGSDNEFKANIDYESSVNELLSKSLMAGVNWPNTEYSIKASFLEKARGKFEGEILVHLNTTRELKATAVYTNKSNNMKLEHEIEFRARGFTTMPISGSIGLSAIEKQSHIGCQIQFEGQKPYSRISTSLDYSHSKLSHKLEGKVTYNEKKYNGEILYAIGSSGGKNLTIDLQLENHIFMEGTLHGMLPQPMIASFLIVPDKDNNPNSRMKIEGQLDPYSVMLGLDYFGEEMAFAGRYDNTSVAAEVTWPEDKKFMVSIAVPEFALTNAQIEIDIITPFDGYTNISFTAQHELEGPTWKSLVNGGIENTIANFNLSGTLSAREVSISTGLNLTGYPTYQGSILVLRMPKRKSFQVAIKHGENDSLLDFDFIRLDEGYLGKLDFRGFSSLPEISMEVNHQFSASHISSYNTKVQWATEGTNIQNVVLLVKHQNHPFSIEATLNSPWTPVKHLDASLTWDPERQTRQISATLGENSLDVNSRAELNLVGNFQDFNHEMKGEWYSQAIRLTVSGGFNGVSDSSLHTILHLPDDHISFDLLSKKEIGKYIGEFKADLNAAITSGGLKWDFTSDASSPKLASIWGQAPLFSPTSATFEYDNIGSKKLAKMNVISSNTSVINLHSEWDISSSRLWNTTLVLKSTLVLLPSLEFTSTHNLVYYKNIRHATSFRIIPVDETTFWLNKFNVSTRHISADLLVENLEDISGTAIFGDADFSVNGKIVKEGNGYNANVKIGSNQFHEMRFQGTYQRDDEKLSTTGQISNHAGESIVRIQADTSRGAEEQTGKLIFSSAYTPSLEGFAGLTSSPYLGLSLYLLKNQENLFTFNARSTMVRSMGNARVTLTSTKVPSIAHIQLDLDYKVAGGGMNGNLKFQDNELVHVANVELAWEEDAKHAKLSYDGATSFSFEANLEGMRKLVGQAVYKGQKLGELSISYQPEQGNFQFGKHGVYITFTDRTDVDQNVNFIVGVDPKKILLNIQTPITNWTDVTIDGQMTSTTSSKAIKFLLKRESESIEGSFESKTSRKTGSLQLVSELSVVGFTRLRHILIEAAQATAIEGLSAVHPQKFSFSLNWATSSINVKVDTPVDLLRSVSLTGNWEYKKPQKFINMGGNINDQNYDFNVEMQTTENGNNGKLRFVCSGVYSLNVNYDFSEEDYKAHLTLNIPNSGLDFGGEILIRENSLGIKLSTPFENFESILLSATRGNPTETSGIYSLAWDVNGISDKLGFQYAFEQGRIELRAETPIQPWNSVVVTIIHDSPFKRLTFHSQRGDGKEVKVSFEIDSTGNMTVLQSPASSSILVAIETPVENFENIKFSLLYDRKNFAHVANISVSRNSGETEGKLNMMYQQSQPVALDISAYLTSPALTSKATAHASLLVDPSGESTVSAHVQANGKRYEMYGLYQLTSTLTKFEMRTTLPFLRQLRFALKKSNSMGLQVFWNGNNKQVEVNGNLLLGGFQSSRASFNVSTPADIFGSFAFEGDISNKLGATSATIVFQNHEVRWRAKLDRLQGSGKEDWRLQVNTPLAGYKHVVVSLKHLLNHVERNVVGVVQLNKRELSLKFSLKRHQLSMTLGSELSYLPIQSKIEADWGKELILKIATNTGNHEYGSSANLDLQGISQGKLAIAISALDHLDTKLDWRFEGDGNRGRGFLNIKNPLLGSKVLRSNWKNENWEEVHVEGWMRSGIQQEEKGISIQYKVTPHQHYGSVHATANYTFMDKPQIIVFEGKIDEQSSHIIFDSMLRTPHDDFRTFEVKGQLTMSSEIGIKLNASLNEEPIIDGDLNLFVTPLRSGIKINLDLPLVTDPLKLDASYDLTSENKLVSLKFQQIVYLIDLKLSVSIPQSSGLVDVNLQAESNVPALPIDVSGNIRMEYAVSRDGTRQVSVHLKHNKVGEWKLMGRIKASANLHCKVVFDGPTSTVPILMLEFNFRGNVRQGISSDITVIVNDSEITGTMLFGSRQWLTNFKCLVGSLQYSGDARVNFEEKQTDVEIRYNGDQNYSFHISGNVNVTSEARQGSSTVTITSGANSVVPLALEIVVGNEGNMILVGRSHEKNVNIVANLMGTNESPWAREGTTGIKVEGDLFGNGKAGFNLQASHFIRNMEYSFNATLDDLYSAESYFRSGRNAAIFVNLRDLVAQSGSVLNVRVEPSTVTVHVNAPGWVNGHLLGDYGSSSSSAFFNGIIHLNNYKSILNTSLSTEGNQTLCKAILDLPSINQRVDLEIQTVTSGPQNLGGSILLKVNEQEFQISGSLKSKEYDSIRGERYVERLLQLSGNFSCIEVTNTGITLYIEKPLRTYSSLNIIGTLTINDQTSTVSGAYVLPNQNTSAELYLKLKSSLFQSDENYEFFLKSFGNGLKKVEGKLNFKLTRFDILWDFVQPTSVLSVGLTGRSDAGDRLLFQVESIFNPNEIVQLSLNCHCSETDYTFRTTLTRSTTAVVGYLYVDAPPLLQSTNEYKVSVTKNFNGSYTMEASAVRGRLILELAGDASVAQNNVNVILKAMGSYGSHYADITGSRNDDEYAVEVTLESSSLLVDKRVNIRGTVALTERNINANIQCRARRNIHELSVSLSRGEGSGKLMVNLESPTFDPAKLEAEWDSREKYYAGQLKIQAWNKAHQSEFGINLEDFEGKLHIISPLLPSNEFNFHVRSIVNSENFDVLGDVRIRGSHWRLEGIASFFSLRNMTFKIETRTPFEFLDRITLGIKSTADVIYLEIHTPASYVPSVMFQLGGLQGLEQGKWHGLKPNLAISLPNGKYSAEASLELPNYETIGLIHVTLQYTGKKSQAFELHSEISPLKTFKLQMENPGHMELKLTTPFEILPQVGLDIDGEINSKRSGKLLITGFLNSYNGKFDASFDNSNGNMQAATGLVTNVPGYEKSIFAIAIETFQGIGNGKSFHVEFRKPDWENLFRLDADYRYIFESLTELEGEINVNMDSYMNVPSLHTHLKSGMKNSRYTGIIEGIFGAHHPAFKVEIKNGAEKINVIVEGKAGANDSYVLTNALEVVPIQNNFSFKEKLYWNGWQVVGMEAILSDFDELFEGYVHLKTPWGPVDSSVVLTPITMLSMDQTLSLSELLRNTNITVDVRFKDKKLLGLELVSKNGMRMFEIQNPIRPVSLSLGVERLGWNSLRLKAGVCWDLTTPEKSSLGINAYMYRKSTGVKLGFFLAGAKYGIIVANFEHYLISSKLMQNLMIQWNAHSGRMGDIGYTLNLTDKSTGLKRQMDYEVMVVAPSRSILIYGGSTSQDKNRVDFMSVAWDAKRDAEKVLSFNVSSTRSTTWRTAIESRSIEIRHFAWSEPILFSIQKQLIHDSMRQFEVKIQPSSNPSEHFTLSSTWDNGDWSSMIVAVSQPVTKVEIEAKYNITEQHKLLKFNYMLFNGDSKMAAVTLDKTVESQELLIQSGDVARPTTVASFITQVSSFGHSVKGEILRYQIIGNIRTPLPYLELTLRHDNVNRAYISCGLPHPKEIVLKATRSELTKTINDINILARLNSSSLLSTRIHWRPELFDEIQDYDWLKGSKDLMQELLPSYLQISTAMWTEINGHWNLLSPPVKQFMSSIYQISAYEINLIYKEVQVIGQLLQKMYTENAFFIKDIVSIIRTSLAPVLKIFEKISVVVKEMCVNLCYYTMNAGKIVSNAISKYYGRLEELVISTWDDMDEIVIRIWRNNAERIESLLEELEEWIDSLVEAFEGRIEMLESKLMAVGFIKNIIGLYRDYATWMDELPIDDYVTAIEDFFQIKVWDRLAEIFGPYLESVQNALDDEYLQELLETPPIPYIRFVLKQSKTVLVSFWDIIEFEKKAKELIRHAMRNIDGLMQRNFPTWELEWDLDRGVIQYDQSLSFIHWVDFTQSPQWRVHAQEEEEINQITNLYYQIFFYIENLKPAFHMRIREILPPFGSLAMMAGDYHYYTFDKKYFHFAGECSYVLVADLLHNGFSFIVNYQSRDGAIRKKSYSIALKNHNIEFDTETFKVTVDSKKVELPIKVDSVYIRRQETRLDVYDTRGYQITCTLSPSVCTFTTSGWYYGKLAGLLGTYDNEPINDFRSPDGQIISDVSTFAYSWRVGKNRNQCRMKNFAKEETESTDVDNICYDLLGNMASPLRPCFNTVDTTIFMEMCKYDISRNINNAKRAESTCTSMSAYVTECQKHNIDVWIPPTCVRCKLKDGTAFTTGEHVTLQKNGTKSPPSSSDIVILLEEKECVNQIDLSNAIAKLEGSLRAEGIVDNRYAVIGFGGQGIHYDAHIQTSSANVWSHSTLFRAPDSSNITGVRKSDFYSAIHLASTMTYRAGVSKTLIAITCGDDKCGDSIRYADTLTMLVENDFKLHMLTPKPLTLKGKKKQDDATRIFGFDTNGVYTLQHAKRGPLVADPSYKRQLNLPKDLCTPLAVETNGTRFSTDNVSKKMLDVWSRRVAQSAHPSECQRCECVPDLNGGSRLMCNQCVSPTLWRFMEEWKIYKAQEIDETYGLDILDPEPFSSPI
ncbi:unnamed protein product [Orchesella dallaii]|uniref:Apolipophorin n=1 Tax=Orchesella dallaii TaxID=48710 RepID=A0ABP1PUG5_9HEXA